MVSVVMMNRTFENSVTAGRLSVWFAVVVMVLALLIPNDGQAFFSKLNYSTQEMGKREVLSFRVPPGASRPKIKLVEEKKLELIVDGLLALPAPGLNTARSLWIEKFHVTEIPGGKMGLRIIIDLKQPMLNFRDSIGKEDVVEGSLYRLEIDKPEKPVQTGPAKLLEGRVLPGKDGTLIVFSHTGNGFVESTIDKSSNLVGLHWRKAGLGSSWRDVLPGGLVEKILAYEFPRDQVELEIILNEATNNIRFHRSSKIGLFIVELVAKNGMGRAGDIERIMSQRRFELEEEGFSRPLNRLRPFFTSSDAVAELSGIAVDEAYFMDNAKEAEASRNFARARGHLDNLLDVFPNTANREIIDFYKVDLAKRMDWKPGWLLTELEAAMARHPNEADYSEHRLWQLQLYNDAKLYGSAANIMWDPNLPKGVPDVWLERGRTAIGLARAQVDPRENEKAATGYLEKILEVTRNKGPHSAEANYLLAELSDNDGDMNRTLGILDGLTQGQLSILNKRPDRIMGIADLYYKYTRYSDAVRHYASLLENYPTQDQVAPWALLRAAESNHQLSKIAKAAGDEAEAEARMKETKLLFNRLSQIHVASDAAVWGKIFELSLDAGSTVDERLKKLDALIDEIALPDALAEAQLSRADLLGQSGRYHEALNTLNDLLTLTSRQAVVRRADRFRKLFLVDGMADALDKDRPEFATLLAEIYGENWRTDPNYPKARIHLAEALMRMGSGTEAMPILEGLNVKPAPAMRKLGKALISRSYLGLPTFSELGEKMSPAVARVRLDESDRLVRREEWEGVLILLERLPIALLNEAGKEKRLKLLAKAEAGRGRFPQTVRHLEDLFFQKPIGDGKLFYWYGTILQKWKGDEKSLSTYQRVAKESTDPEIKALALVRIGDIFQRKGDFPGAREQYLEAVKLAPETAWANVSDENAAQLQMAMDVGK
jgi:tetratricopeptide (TPR) repeat protein